jgi:hypothetical protein
MVHHETDLFILIQADVPALRDDAPDHLVVVFAVTFVM